MKASRRAAVSFPSFLQHNLLWQCGELSAAGGGNGTRKNPLACAVERRNHYLAYNLKLSRRLSLNFAKTQFIKFIAKNNNQIEININYDNKLIPATTYTKFLGLPVNCSVTWTNHIDLLTKN